LSGVGSLQPGIHAGRGGGAFAGRVVASFAETETAGSARRLHVKTMKPAFLEVNSLIERLHRSFLELVKLELERLGIHDINHFQGLMLFDIGDAQMSVSELTFRGCYLARTLRTMSKR
jgi:hypothetical protein